jgi:hypothetical protein
VVLVVLAVAGFAYWRIGWEQMREECSPERHMAGQEGEVTYSWSWKPPGFTCTYTGGFTRTDLWF